MHLRGALSAVGGGEGTALRGPRGDEPEDSSAVRLSSKVMTCGFDWWEETMQQNDISFQQWQRRVYHCPQSSDSDGADGDKNPYPYALPSL